jgi:hypothetical protein
MSNTQQFRRKHATVRARKPRLVNYQEVKALLDADDRSISWLARQMGVTREFLRCCMNGTYAWPEDRLAQLNTILGTNFSVPDEVLSA